METIILYYLILLIFIGSIVTIIYCIELYRKKSYRTHSKCTYCGLPHTSKWRISYGFPGSIQIVKCNRWWCTICKYLGYFEVKDYNHDLVDK